MVAQHGGSAEFFGEGGGFAGQLSHSVPIASAREGVRRALDQEPAHRGAGSSDAAQIRVISG
ncbi:hypothetical protein [Streptomyces scabiei]|uniref:hypothetical protein n=1 Tax=Streptomyces scabiei TaxID=1930 RepID=UPI0004BE9B99|nr:hypothetical protein [Streptomyces scabiei]MDX3275813.1 hypothetical protein [Streptomyces scabiei]